MIDRTRGLVILASIAAIFLLVGTGFLGFPIFSSILAHVRPSNTGGAPADPQACAYYIFFSRSGATYQAMSCATGSIVFGGPKNLGGASGKSAFQVIQDALNSKTQGYYELSSNLFNVSGTISLAMGQVLEGQNPGASQLIETKSITTLVSIDQSGSYAGLESLTLQGVNGADVLQIQGSISSCPRYQTFSDVFVKMAIGNSGTSSQWLVHIFCSFESTLDFVLGNPGGQILNSNFFKWQNNNFPTSTSGNSQTIQLVSLGATNGIDYDFEHVSHIDVSRVDGTGNGNSSIGLILNNTADLSFENSDLELFGQVVQGISDAATTFSQFYGSSENSSTFAAAMHFDSNSYAIIFENGALDGPVFGYYKPAVQTDFSTTCHICAQTIWGFFSPTFQVNWKGRAVYNFTNGGLGTWSFNFFSINPPSLNTWYQNEADTPVLITESFTFAATSSNMVVNTGFTESTLQQNQACVLGTKTPSTLSCTFLVPTGAYWEYTNSTSGPAPSLGVQSATPSG